MVMQLHCLVKQNKKRLPKVATKRSLVEPANFSRLKCEPLVHILPVNERQCRPLKSLKPQQQREAWNLAISVANNRVPSGTIVKKAVNQIKTENTLATAKENHNNRREGINYVRGVGVEWYVRVDEETWHQLKIYAEKVGTATLSGAINRLLSRIS